ncbi:MAG TPA: hypothetical protein VM534_01120 [Thermoanaerobaculia bacterium]|nr:hypothetical protein [Thermoanaerobaculia bacterium]
MKSLRSPLLALALSCGLLLPSTAPAEVRCDSPADLALTELSDSPLIATATMTLTWEPAARAGSYDLFLGPVDPPPLYRTGITGTTVQVDGLATGTTYYWYVVARAECDPTLTSRSELRSFTVAGSCTGAGAFALSSPANGAEQISVFPTLQWSASPGAASYDLYLGRSESPALIAAGITSTSIVIPRLLPATRYHWRVIARSGCNSSSVSSAAFSFTVTSSCPSPSPTSMVSVPADPVAVGQTYTISWEQSEGIDAGGSYIVERSSSSSFSPVLDRQQTTATSASFLSAGTGTFHHRIRAVAGCNAQSMSGWSSSRSVDVVPGSANVVFTVQPTPVITALGDRLEDQKTTFTIENIGTSSVQVLVGRQELASVPFFRIIDPLGGDAAFFTLEPRKPKTLEIRFSGPPNDQGGSYQGIVYLASTGEAFAINPLAYVNLRVGGRSGAPPKFLVGGLESEYTFFPPKKGDDSDRAAITVDVLNSGSEPMELAAEIGPEIWLVPESGWNATAIAANSFRPVRLTTRRNRAPNGSALPRYTWFTIRNKDGESARLLVQDNTAFEIDEGRDSLFDLTERSFVIPTVTTRTLGNGDRVFTRLRISNVGAAAVQTEIFYTPTGADGFGDSVRKATVLIPPNDVVNLTDPLAQLFSIAGSSSGQMEIRAAAEKIGLLIVTSAIETTTRTGGVYAQGVPTLIRGEGTRIGTPHRIGGFVASGTWSPALTLAETTGRETTSVRVSLFDANGAKKGDRLVSVPQYGRAEIENVVSALGGGASMSGGRIDLAVESGGGAVAGVVAMTSTAGSGSSFVSTPSVDGPPFSTLGRMIDGNALGSSNGETDRFVAPLVVNGVAPLSGQAAIRTALALLADSAGEASFNLRFVNGSTGSIIERNVTVAAGRTTHYANVLQELFGLSSSATTGSLIIESTGRGRARAFAEASLSSGAVSDAMPVVSFFSEALTGGGSDVPLFADGIEQSIDATRGSRANLTLTEVAGSSLKVRVRLYEAGNRSQAIAEKEMTVPAGGQVKLDGLFAAMGLESAERRKDRANVQVAVSPVSGQGLIAGVLQTIDNRTGQATHVLLMPGGGVPATDVQQVETTPPSQPARQRPARRR